MNSILNLVRKKSKPAEVRGLSCLSQFSIGIKVSNAVQESVILALTVAQTSLSIWSRSIFFVEPIHSVIFIKSQKGHYHLKKMKFVVYRSWKGTLSGRINYIYTVLCLVYSISWDVRFNDKTHLLSIKLKEAICRLKYRSLHECTAFVPLCAYAEICILIRLQKKLALRNLYSWSFLLLTFSYKRRFLNLPSSYKRGKKNLISLQR